ncbi:hypothetical protein MYX77_04590 [Acidobacteriia bacterium AH_259_A11_L15]|nr:hypothetical protein [Acidobacteriia bacterium AH_259_A11_L15]
MLRKGLLVGAALLLVPALLSAYTMVLRDGRRLEAQSHYTFEGNLVRFVGADGQVYRLLPTEVDFEATYRANTPNARIWTNEDLEQLGEAPVSIVGSGRSSTAGTTASSEGTGEEGGEGEGESLPPVEDTAEYWQGKLRELYTQIDQIDEQIESLRTGQGEAASNRVSVQDDAAGIDVTDTIQRFERRKQELQEEIRQVELQARRQGIPPGKLRRHVVMRAPPR